MQNPELYDCYRHVLRSADFVMASPSTLRGMLRLGVDESRIYHGVNYAVPTEYFRPGRAPLDIEALRTAALQEPNLAYGEAYVDLLRKEFRPDLPTIGIYGKLGYTKGSFDLLEAMAELRRSGVEFNLVGLTQGRRAITRTFAERVHSNGVADSVWLLPFVPNWDIPRFIAACTATCFLERNFPIAIHRPLVPREVLASGGCLLLSRQVAEYQRYSHKLDDGRNVLLVDPTDLRELGAVLHSVISRPDEAREIGMRGYEQISRPIENYERHVTALSQFYEDLLLDVTERRRIMSLSEMQAAFGRLLVDDKMRGLLGLDIDAALHGYELSQVEKETIASIDRRMLDYFAGSLIYKRLARIEPAYRLAFQRARDQCQTFFERFCNMHPALPGEATFDQVQRFGAYLEDCFRGRDVDAPPHMCDLIRYERTIHAVAFRPHPADDVRSINSDALTAGDEPGPEAMPRLTDGVVVVEFGCDIVDLVEKCRSGDATVAAVEPMARYYVFRPVKRTTTPEVFAVGADMASLLHSCNGHRAVTELAQRILGRVDPARLLPVLEQLHGRGLVTWQQADTGPEPVPPRATSGVA
jgi:hypothetical protein